jgi:hypothetical protein
MASQGPGSPDDQTRLEPVDLPADLTPITTRYDILEECGRGGMGIVYKARDRHTNDAIAIKVLNPIVAANAELIDRFKNELVLARKVTHKNVCRVYDLNDFSGVMAISMEYVPGESLRDVLNRAEGVSVRYGLRVVRQIIAGLAEAHAQGVVHRDLKPSNIQIAPDGAVKVMDFGIARSVDSNQTSSGLIVGTPAYMSPEQAEGKPPDARSDVYALGLVMFEMFCGEPVFSADSTTALVAKHVHEKPRSPREIEPDLPRRLERAILRSLEKNPGDRFQSVEELAAALLDEPAAAQPRDGAVDDVTLPSHLASWQAADTLLMLVAAAAAAIFVLAFDRTSLMPHSQVVFDDGILRRIVQEHLQRLQLPAATVDDWHIDLNTGVFTHLSATQGIAAAKRVAGAPLALMHWHAGLGTGASITVDHRGDFFAYERSTPNPAAAPASVEESRAVAERSVRAAWNRAADSLTLERSTTGQTHSFTWVSRQPIAGFTERFTAAVDNRGLRQLVRSLLLPEEMYRPQSINWEEEAIAIIMLIASAMGLVYRKRVNAGARWRAVVAVLAFLTAAGYVVVFLSFPATMTYLIAAIGFGFIGALVWILGSIALEALLARTKPGAFRSLMALAGGRIRTPIVGLAIVRGTLIGLAVLGLDALLVWVTTTFAGGWSDTSQIPIVSRALSLQWPVAVSLTFAFVQMMDLGLIICFIVAVVDRLASVSWVRVLLATALLTASGIGISLASMEPYYWRLPVLAVVLFVLVLAFRRFDVLTVMVANFTIGFCWVMYPMSVVLQQAGAAWILTAAFIWAAIVIGAAVVAFEEKLTFAYRRLSGSFE